MQKKIFFLGYFNFLRKKADFRARFWNGQCSVTEPGPTPSPWNITLCSHYCVGGVNKNTLIIDHSDIKPGGQGVQLFIF